MTTELEQEFFKVFGIEPKWKDKRVKNSKTYYTKDQADYLRATTKNRNIQLCYPEITDRKLLEMICINSYFCGVNFHHLWVKNPDEIKAIILDEIIRWYKEQKYGHEKCKHQIQELFKEGK